GQSNALDSVSGHDGTPLNGASLMNALVGRGFYLAGSNQCVKIPYAPSLATSNYSIETWVEPLVDMNSGDEAVIFAQSQGQCQLMLRGGSFGPRAVFQFSVNGLTYDLVSSNPIAIGGFTHLAGTWNGTTLRLYIGGA